MEKDLSIPTGNGKRVVIEEVNEMKRVLKVQTDSTFFKHGELMAMPRDFKKLSTEEKIEALKAMEEDGMSRSEMSYLTNLSAGRISQLIGKKRKDSPTKLYVSFQPPNQ